MEDLEDFLEDLLEDFFLEELFFLLDFFLELGFLLDDLFFVEESNRPGSSDLTVFLVSSSDFLISFPMVSSAKGCDLYMCCIKPRLVLKVLPQ